MATDRELQEQAAEWAPAYKILSDPTRLCLLLTMHHFGPGQRPVAELADHAGVKLTTASAALNSMAAAGIINAQKEGRQTRYALTDERIHRLLHHQGATHRD